MWAIYESELIELDDFEKYYFGVTNDPIAAEQAVKDGYIVTDMDTHERFE